MQARMNAIAHASALPASGPRLDNRRVLAALIDLVVIAAGAAVIGLVAAALAGGGSEFPPAFGAILLAWALYYYFACESGGGQTIGKRVMRLRVVRADGTEAGMREIFVRTILRVIDGIALYLVGLVVMLITGKRRQRLGDLAAATVVVDVAALVEPPASPAAAVAEPPVQAITLPEAPVEHVPDRPVVADRPTEPVPTVSEPVVEVDSPTEPVPTVSEPVVEADPSEADPPEAGPPAERAPAGDAVVVRSVETVSAIELVMGDEEQEESGSGEPDAGHDDPDR
jgi:uncharacterized RDD family membrane protein YckC